MKVRQSRPVLLACTAITLLWAAAPAFAQDEALDGDEILLENIEVKGDRPSPGAVTDTPLATTVTSQQIENRQVNSIEDLGRSLEPGVNFNRNTGALNIRGLEGSRVLTTIDGIPVPYLADPTRGASGGVDTFDFSSLSAIDVLRGGDSSRAGSGALGGVLGLFTLEPEDLIREGRTWGGIVKLSYDSADDSIGGTAAVATRFDNTAILFQGGYKTGDERDNKGDVDTYGNTRTLPNPSDFDQYNLLFKLRHHAEGGHMFGVTAERFHRDRVSDAKTSQSLVGNYRPGQYTTMEDSDRDRVSLDYLYDGSSGVFDSVAASLYWLDQGRSTGYEGVRSTAQPLGPITRMNDYHEETIGLVGSAEKTVTTGDLTHRFLVGLDVATATANQYAAGEDNCPPGPPYPPAMMGCNFLHTNQADMPKVDSNRMGLFVEDEISFGDTGFYVTPGVRFDWLERTPTMTPEFDGNASDPDLPPAFSDSAISPKLRLGYRPTDTLELYGQWAMGFRAPTTGELYAAFGGPGTYIRIGNPDLESETSQGFEIGARLGDENFGGRVNLFYNRYRNFIEARGLTADEALALGYDPADYPNGITAPVNRDRVRIYGVEVSAHKYFDNGFGIRAGLAYADGKNLDDGTFLQSVAPLKGMIGVSYDTDTWGVGVDFIAAAAAKGETTRSNTGAITYFKTPSYGIVDLTAWWEPEQLNGFKINAGVYNVFDTKYYDYINVRNGGSQPEAYYSEPGRTFKVSLTQRF